MTTSDLVELKIDSFRTLTPSRGNIPLRHPELIRSPVAAWHPGPLQRRPKHLKKPFTHCETQTGSLILRIFLTDAFVPSGAQLQRVVIIDVLAGQTLYATA